MRIGIILYVACAAIASTWLAYLVDDGLGLGWPHNVVRNWEEFGIIDLHGGLVTNPGGFEAVANPAIYPGMSPLCLYPVYFSTAMFSWLGLGTLPFHFLLSLAVLWAVWRLLGRSDFALAIALAAVLSPGCIRWPRILDPNTLTVLYALPYAVIVLAILKRPRLTPTLAAGLSVLTLVFTSLNWTTAWVFGPAVLLFWGIPGVNRRLLILFISVTAISVGLVVAVLFTLKFGDSGGAAPANPIQVLGGYTWGSNAYGVGLTTGKAFLRLAFVNGVGLFPLWLALVYVVARRIDQGARLSWLMFAPLALTLAEVGLMRNYFGHHPWMAGPLLLVGLLFSIALLRAPSAEGAVKWRKAFPPVFVPTAGLLCFVYALAVLASIRANETSLLSLEELVRHHTARSDVIVIVKHSDPTTAQLIGRLGEPLDRRVVVVDDFEDLTAKQDHGVVLSAVRLEAPFVLTAQSAIRSPSWLGVAADWFNRSIARRNPGDRLELSATYFLYEPGR